MSYSSEEMDDLEMPREDFVGELAAVDQYHGHVSVLENEEAVSTPEHIVEEEKEHIAELLRLVHSLDLGQADEFEEIL